MSSWFGGLWFFFPHMILFQFFLQDRDSLGVLHIFIMSNHSETTSANPTFVIERDIATGLERIKLLGPKRSSAEVIVTYPILFCLTVNDLLNFVGFHMSVIQFR